MWFLVNSTDGENQNTRKPHEQILPCRLNVRIQLSFQYMCAIMRIIIQSKPHARRNMATPNPAQQIASDISNLQFKIGNLQISVRLTNARDSVEDVQTTINGLAQRIATLRT